MKKSAKEVVKGYGSLVWNNQHVFTVKSVEVPQPEMIEAVIDGVPNASFLLGIQQSITFRGEAYVEFKSNDVYLFKLFMNDHKFTIKGRVDRPYRTMLKVIHNEPIEIIY